MPSMSLLRQGKSAHTGHRAVYAIPLLYHSAGRDGPTPDSQCFADERASDENLGSCLITSSQFVISYILWRQRINFYNVRNVRTDFDKP